MSDTMRVTGMFSGMDTESIVTQLVEAKSTKVTNLKNEQKKLEWKQTAWQDLNSKVYNLYSKTLSNLRLTSAYTKKKTTCSDTTKASVVASDSAIDGTQTLQVNQLAKAGYLTGAKLSQTKTVSNEDGTTSSADWETTDTLASIDSTLTGKTISVTTGTGDAAKTTEIELTSDMTINGLISKFKEAGINASFDTGNQRFFLSSSSTGADNNFTISGDDAALESLGLLAGTNGAVKVDGQDAQIVLNGATFTSDSNTFSVNGLTITTSGVTDSEVTIVTSTDYDSVYNTIKDFISEYNDLINEIDKLYNADSARDYDMLTDDEKESMTDDEIEQWEDKIKGALLRKDSSLSTIMNGLTSTMLEGFYQNELTDKQKESMSASEISTWYKENGGKKYYLSDFGIATLSYFECEDNEHHAYHIDGDADDENTSGNTDKLKKAIASDPEGVANFFSNLCKALYNKLDETMGTSTDYSSIYKIYNDKQLKEEYEDYDDKISDAQDELDDYEDRWYDKFTAMEVALSKLQSQSSSISSLLGTS